MPSISMSVPHALGQDQAVARLKAGFGMAREGYQKQVNDLVEEWDGNLLKYSFKTLGMAVSGTVAVEPAEVRLTASLPLAAALFRGMIEQQIRDQMTRLLA